MSSQTSFEKLHQEAHAWFIVPEAVQEPSTLETCLSLLCEQELRQYRRFHFAEDRHRYLVSHALVRNVLSRYVDLRPAEWNFSRSQHGKPEVANPGIPALQFNLTHTAGLAGCVVSFSDACGIDAEKITGRHNPAGVAKRMFSEAETRELEQLEGEAYLEHFFTRWTLREAYVKARGIGISFPTRKLTFTLDRDNAVEVSFHPDIEDRQDNWHFQLLRPTEEHIAAIAIRRNGDIDKKIVTRFIEF
jgi:4'-phosphopantetheinyl transferase